MSSINGNEITFLKVPKRFQPATSLTMGKTCSKKRTQLLSRDEVNNASEISITRYVLDVIEALCIALNCRLLSFVIRTKQRRVLLVKNSQGVHDNINKCNVRRATLLRAWVRNLLNLLIDEINEILSD